MQRYFIGLLLLFTLNTIAQKPELVLPVGHTSRVMSAQFSHDGDYIVSASTDGTAKIWDGTTGKILRTLEGNTDLIDWAEFNPDDDKILTVSDEAAVLWESLTGKILFTFNGHSDKIESAHFSPKGNYVITQADLECFIWDVSTGNKLISHKYGLETLKLSPDEKYLIRDTESEINYDLDRWVYSIDFIECQTGNLIFHPSVGHFNEIFNIQFSPDGKYFLTASADSTAKIWRSSDGKLLKTLKINYNYSFSAYFVNQGENVLTISGSEAKFWSRKNGKLLRRLNVGSEGISSLVYYPDNQYIITITKNKDYASLWDANTFELINSFSISDFFAVTYQYFKFWISPEGQYLFITDQSLMKMYETKTGKEIHTIDLPGNYVDFYDDDRFVLGLSQDVVRKWDVITGDLLLETLGPSDWLYQAQLSPNRKFLITRTSDVANIWNYATGRLIYIISEDRFRDGYPSFSPDSKYIITSSDTTIKILESHTGRLINTLNRNYEPVGQASFSPNGNLLLIELKDTASIWDTENWRLIHLLDHPNNLYGSSSAKFNSDGTMVVTVADNFAKIWDGKKGNLLHSLEIEGGTRDIRLIKSATFTPDDKYILTGNESFYGGTKYNTIIWDCYTGKMVDTLEGRYKDYILHCSPDGKNVMSKLRDSIIGIWDIPSGELIHSYKLDYNMGMLFYCPDGENILTKDDKNSSVFLDISTGQVINKSSVFSESYLEDVDWRDSISIWKNNSKITFRDLQSDEEFLSLIPFNSGDWVITHPSGLFDASPGAMDKMYFVQGMDVIEFGQLKERYYEPGLWGKVMGNVDNKLRDVEVLDKQIPLYPEIELSPVSEEGYFTIDLQNQGGGIGRVKVLINNKEIIADARGDGFDPETESAQLRINIEGDPRLMPGEDNLISVVAYNGENWVTSRGVNITYSAPPGDLTTPSAYIVSIGVSDYTGEAIDLRYAAKDAVDMAFALKTGAKKLFGEKNTHLWKIVADKSDSATILPTKQNIMAVFDTIQSVSEPVDVLMVYISGHGLNLGGQDGDFYYLTCDAYSGSVDAYNDMAIRNTTTISSTELVEMVKEIPALKQVLILDACHSGKTVENLMVMRNISSTSLRALDRMKDRTGMYIITGCAADAVSYEASRYGQGILTYSLLEGIKGASLREDRFIDVNRLFAWASDRVPVLAEGIGGIQSPMVFSPANAQSFDMGELDTKEKEEIPLARSKPIFVQSMFMELSEMYDQKDIGKTIDEKLLMISSKGTDTEIIFIEAREFPQAYRINGQYSLRDGTIELRANLRKGKELITTMNITAKEDEIEKLTDEILSGALKLCK